MNPDSVQGGYGCKFINPVDMNGYQLSGLTNVYADGSVMTFIDSASSPMLQLTNGGHTSYENINMNNNTIYGASSISSPIFYVSTYGKIDQSGTNNGIVVANNAPYVNGAQATIAFNLNGPTGITTPFKIYNDGLNSIVNLNMNNANINGINTLTGYAGGNITLGSYINMNSNNILNCGAGSTAYTQATADSDSSIATTAFVHNVVNAIPTVQFTTTNPAGQVSVGNLNQSATSLTTVKNGVNTSIVYNSGNLSFNSTATASLLGSYINFPANTLYPSSIGTPTITSNTSYIIITSASGTGMTYPVSIASITPTGFLFTASNIIQATYSLYLNFTLNY